MAYADTFAALANPTRLQLFEALRKKPSSVGELAAGRPMSRPAVSQHLKVLQTAGLVQAEPRGNRRVYAIRREGLEDARRYLDGFWTDALSAFGSEVLRRTKPN